MVKLFKVLTVVGELWKDEQLVLVNKFLQKAFTKLGNVDPSLYDVVSQIQNTQFSDLIESENWDFQLLCNPEKESLNVLLQANNDYKSIVLIYVGVVINPSGLWLLKDGLYKPLDLININSETTLILCMPELSKIEETEWNVLTKKLGERLIFGLYNITENEDIDDASISSFACQLADNIRNQYPKPVIRHMTEKILKLTQPTLCAFREPGSSAVPFTLTLDGFVMLINPGYGVRPELWKYLSFISEVDVGLLTHVGYDNILSLVWGTEPIAMNHLLVPGAVPLTTSNQQGSSIDSAMVLDLRSEMSKIFSYYRSKGTSISHLSLPKCKAPFSWKPLELYNKIGYGKLELYALSPFDDDVELKKFVDDWKKEKYPNELTAGKPLAISISFIIVWRPFNSTKRISRLMYLGSRAPIKKTFPLIIPALHSSFEWLRQETFVPASTTSGTAAQSTKRSGGAGNTKRVTSPPTTAAAGKAALGDRKQSAACNADKVSARPASGVTKAREPQSARTAKQQPTTATAATGKQRPATSTTTKKPATASTTKQPPRPNTATSTTTSKTKKVAQTKPSVADGEVVSVGKPVNSTTEEKVNEIKEDIQLNGNVKDEVPKDRPEELPVSGSGEVVSLSPVSMQGTTADGNKVVAVGTVECAITEHGEADFCDETPEELSVDQMRQLGMYDDDEGMMGQQGVSASVVPNLADLPMEGSFYGKEISADVPTNWTNQPLGMPAPPKRQTTAPSVTTSYSGPHIFVDHVIVPSDLDQQDHRMLWSSVRCAMGGTIFYQLDCAKDLVGALETMLECNSSTGKTSASESKVTIVPSLDDDHVMMWAKVNEEKLTSSNMILETPLTRSSVSIGNDKSTGDQTEISYQGYKWSLCNSV